MPGDKPLPVDELVSVGVPSRNFRAIGECEGVGAAVGSHVAADPDHTTADRAYRPLLEEMIEVVDPLLLCQARRVRKGRQQDRVLCSSNHPTRFRAGHPCRAGGWALPGFDRLGAERSVVEGSGLGLALSRQLAQAMDGSLVHENRRDGGSAFHLDLPMAKRHQSKADSRTGGKHVGCNGWGQWPEASADAP